MYGVVFSFKDPFDTKDMRSTGGGDAAYDIDFPARDHVLVEQLRNKGAIIFAKAVNTEYNGRAGDPGGRHEPDKVLPSTLGYQRSTWAGNPSNPYDTTRAASLGSSSGSGVSVSANLVMASLGEETRASCRGPSNHNAVALILPHKAMLGFDGGAIGADIYCDRSGIHRAHDRRLRQGARRAEGPGRRLLRPARPLHDGAALVGAGDALCAPRRMAGDAGALQGHAHRRHPRVDADPPGAKTRRSRSSPPPRPRSRRCSATSSARRWSNRPIPLWTPDPDIEQMKPDFRRALARLVPVFMPDLLFRLGRDGQPRVQGIRRRDPADRVHARQVLRHAARWRRSTTCVELAEGRIAPPANLDIATIQEQELAMTLPLPHPAISDAPRRRLDRRAASPRRSTDFAALNARSKFWGDDQRAAFKNWEEVADPRNPLGGRQGVDERIMLRELLRRVDMMVILENQLDALVRLHTPLPPAKIGGAHEPGIPQNLRPESFYGPNAGLTEMLIPAGYVTTVYDPVFKLSADGTRYVSGRLATRRPRSRRPACRSRWSSAPSRARKTCC